MISLHIKKLVYAFLLFATDTGFASAEESNYCSLTEKLDFGKDNTYITLFLRKETTHFLEFSENVSEISVGTKQVALVSATENGSLYLTTKNDGLTNIVARSTNGKMFRAIIRVGNCNLRENDFSPTLTTGDNLKDRDVGEPKMNADRTQRQVERSKSDMRDDIDADYKTITVYNGEKKETLKCFKTCTSSLDLNTYDKDQARISPPIPKFGMGN